MLRRNFAGLRERLLVAMAPLAQEECVMSEGEVEAVGSVWALEKTMQSLYTCIENLCKACSTTKEVGTK